VTLQDGDTDKYLRFGDTYIKHNDGTLDDVQGDEKSLKRSGFRAWFQR